MLCSFFLCFPPKLTIIDEFVSVDDLRANTEYSGYSAASPVVQWFWEVVQGFSKEDKARLLQFVTGTSKVPLLFRFYVVCDVAF